MFWRERLEKGKKGAREYGRLENRSKGRMERHVVSILNRRAMSGISAIPQQHDFSVKRTWKAASMAASMGLQLTAVVVASHLVSPKFVRESFRRFSAQNKMIGWLVAN